MRYLGPVSSTFFNAARKDEVDDKALGYIKRSTCQQSQRPLSPPPWRPFNSQWHRVSRPAARKTVRTSNYYIVDSFAVEVGKIKKGDLIWWVLSRMAPQLNVVGEGKKVQDGIYGTTWSMPRYDYPSLLVVGVSIFSSLLSCGCCCDCDGCARAEA